MKMPVRAGTLPAVCAAGGALMALTAGAAALVGDGLPVAPLAATVALAVATPQAPAARPHRIFGAHVACIVCGALAAILLGHGAVALVAAGVLALAVTVGLRLAHPPAVAMAVVVAGGAFAVDDLWRMAVLSALLALAVLAIDRARRQLRPVTA